jgi:hypothetical protein
MATWYANVTNIDGSVTLYNLSDKNPFKLISITGIGNADIRRLEERGPFQQGASDVGYRVDPRTMQLVIQIFGSSASDADTQRDKLSTIFSPIANSPIRLYVNRDDGTTRQIDCFAVSQVDLPAQLPDRILNSQRVMVQLRAPNPFWYDPVVQSVSFYSITPTDPWYLGGGLIGTATVAYQGTVIAQGGTVVLTENAPNSPRTIFFRSQRPTSGTSVAWDWLRLNNYGGSVGTTRQSFVAVLGTVGRIPYQQTNAAGISTGTAIFNYGTAGGSAVTNSRGVTPAVQQFSPAGSATTLVNYLNLGGDSVGYGGGTVTFRQNAGGGSAWANAMSHAAIYNANLSAAQIQGIVDRIENASVATLSGTADVDGNWDEYPIISFVGPIYDPSIENLTTGHTLSLTGTVGASETWVIDTRYGFKTVTTQSGSSIIDKLSDASDLADFRLQPGANILRIVGSGGTTSATQVDIAFYNRFLSA